MTRWTRGQAEVEELIASRQLQKITAGDPDSAFVLAYDSARYAGTALLAHQGLRPTTSGGHYAVEVALRAQFGERASQNEAAEAIQDAHTLLTAAQQLLPRLSLF